MKSFTSHSIVETEKIAADWLKELAKGRGDADKASVVGLSGHLGAGKTAFVKAVAKTLGIKEEVTSPTFVIVKIYDILPKRVSNSTEQIAGDWPWKRLIHIDAYRLERGEELEALGFEKLAVDPNNLIMIEWPENVGIVLKTNHLVFEIRDDCHTISF